MPASLGANKFTTVTELTELENIVAPIASLEIPMPLIVTGTTSLVPRPHMAKSPCDVMY